jgi:release factor glutamine methyltransferase
MIFWNSNFVEAPPDYRRAGPLERAMLDPGYRDHRRYLAQGRRHLTAGGRLLLGFSSMGSVATLDRIATELGYRVAVLTNQVREVPQRVEYLLLDLVDLAR